MYKFILLGIMHICVMKKGTWGLLAGIFSLFHLHEQWDGGQCSSYVG